MDGVMCERCHQPLAEGAHGVGQCPLEPRRGHGLIRDEIPGGQWFENGFSRPRKFYSHAEHRKALDVEGKMLAPKWVPGDKHLTRWVGVDLAGAEAMIRRHYSLLPAPSVPVRKEAVE